MPMYNVLCPECGHDKEEFTTYENFCEHNSSEHPITCPNCGKETAFYSLTHLKENLHQKWGDVLNFFGSTEQEKWFRGMNDLGRR